MKIYRFLIPVLLVAAVLAILLHSDRERAIAKPTEYSLCNVSISHVPGDVEVGAYPAPDPSGRGKIYLLIYVPLAGGQRVTTHPSTGQTVPAQMSRVAIDAQTGEVAFEFYRPNAPEEKGKLGAVLASLEKGPPSPTDDAWPRTDTQPHNDKVTTRGLKGAPGLKYRPPEAGSGMLVTTIQGQPSPYSPPYEELVYRQRLVARTCDSIVEIDTQTGEVVTDMVQPGDREMFDRFLAEVERVGP